MKLKDIKTGTRIVKKHGLGVNNFIVDTPPLRHDVPKVALPKNDTSEKFWASVEPFCAEIQKDDVAVSISFFLMFYIYSLCSRCV